MPYRVVTRKEWFDGVPYKNDTVTPRPYIGYFENGVAVHFTGSPLRPRNYTMDPIQLMQEELAWAVSAGKAFEYNYKILPRADGSAVICEYAGLYMGAHAGETGIYLNNNSTRCAIQFAIGVNNHPSYPDYNPNKLTVWEELTPSMIEAFQGLRYWLLTNHHISDIVLPDKQLPGRRTACAGLEVDAHWSELLELPNMTTPVRNNPPLSNALDALAVVMTYCAVNPGNDTQTVLWDIVLPHMTGIRVPVGDPRRAGFVEASNYPGGGKLAAWWESIVGDLDE